MVDSKRIPEIVSSIKSNYIRRRIHGYSEEDVETVASELIDRLEIFHPPIPIVAILKSLGFNIYVSDMPSPNISGFIIIDSELQNVYGTDRIVSVSKHDDLSRQRFVLAHEFGHFLFDYNENNDETYFDTYDFIKSDKEKEFIPSKFAAELLMPSELFEEKRQKLSINEQSETDVVEQLMYNFGVNKKSVLKRYNELKIDKVGVGI